MFLFRPDFCPNVHFLEKKIYLRYENNLCLLVDLNSWVEENARLDIVLVKKTNDLMEKIALSAMW
jgi:hypothetical protein